MHAVSDHEFGAKGWAKRVSARCGDRQCGTTRWRRSVRASTRADDARCPVAGSSADRRTQETDRRDIPAFNACSLRSVRRARSKFPGVKSRAREERNLRSRRTNAAVSRGLRSGIACVDGQERDRPPTVAAGSTASVELPRKGLAGALMNAAVCAPRRDALTRSHRAARRQYA